MFILCIGWISVASWSKTVTQMLLLPELGSMLTVSSVKPTKSNFATGDKGEEYWTEMLLYIASNTGTRIALYYYII